MSQMCKLSLHNLHKAKFIPTKFRLATLIILSPLCARPRPFCHFERSREISKRSDGQNGRLLILRLGDFSASSSGQTPLYASREYTPCNFAALPLLFAQILQFCASAMVYYAPPPFGRNDTW